MTVESLNLMILTGAVLDEHKADVLAGSQLLFLSHRYVVENRSDAEISLFSQPKTDLTFALVSARLVK